MSVNYHLPDDLLMDYAAGTTPEALSLLVATHTTLCPACRRRVGDLESVGGALLEEVEAADVGTDFDVLMRSIDAGPAVVETESDSVIQTSLQLPEATPRPLRRYLAGVQWSWAAPGVHDASLGIELEGVPVRLVRLKAGFRMPYHTHRGMEFTQVISGGFKDRDEHYVVGDVCVRDDSISHDFRVDDDGSCVCLVVNEAPLIPLTVYGRLANLFARF